MLAIYLGLIVIFFYILALSLAKVAARYSPVSAFSSFRPNKIKAVDGNESIPGESPWGIHRKSEAHRQLSSCREN